jgi:hypothetical protein
MSQRFSKLWLEA